ncbi:MAG TPA: trigger factor [Kiritimatiellia bacterium]|nr:trigger factor [Kiritimatiellia bacterium]
MNSNVSAVGPCRRHLEVTVPADKVGEEFNDVISNYLKYARMPGFRPGKAPRNMVVRRFQKDIVKEVKERLIPQGYQAALKEHGLKPVTVLDVTEPELKEGEAFTFSVMIDVKPEVTLPSYKGLTVEAKPVEVSDEHIDEVLNNLRQREGKFEEAPEDTLVSKGDLVQVDFEATVDGAPLVEKAPAAGELSSGKGFWLFADDESFVVQDFTRQLVGFKKGEERMLDVSFPDPHPIAELAGLKAVYQVKVTGIRHRVLPELDAAFLETLGVESLDALKDRIRKDLTEMKTVDETRRQRSELVNQLLAASQIDLPESVVSEETSQEVYDLVSMNSQRGVSSEDIQSNREKIFEMAEKSAKDRLKLRYLCTGIAEEEKLTVSDAEVDARIHRHAMSSRKNPDKLKAEMQKDGGIGYRRLKEQLVAEKGLDFVVQHAVITNP